MVTASESRAALEVVSLTAVSAVRELFSSTTGSPVERRASLLEGVPEVVAYFSEGSAALAADFYEESRELAGVRRPYTVELVVNDRTVKIRRAVAWAADPLFADDELSAVGRLAEVVQLESARPYRDTILTNRRNDPEAAGWRRIANPGACKFCRMLADRGAVYKRETALFASHGNCHCSAQPVFNGEPGEEASVLQYVASKRRRTAKEKAALRDYLEANYAD